MSRLEKILSEHIEGGPGAWKKLYDDIEQYARECCIATQKACAENATMIKRKNQKHTKGIKYYTGENRDLEIVIESESITNPDNIILLD